MRPQDDYRNGDGGISSASRSDDSSGEEATSAEEEFSLQDADAPARVLGALNALRKARQHYDVVLTCGGCEVAAHRAVLAAVSPRLLAELAAVPAGGALLLPDVEPDALRELVEFAYTGRLRVRTPTAARRLYRAAARLRLDAARAPLAERLLRAPSTADCLELRALPGLRPQQRQWLDAFVAEHFDELPLGALPLVRLELLHDDAATAEPAAGVADAALGWLRGRAGGRLSDAALEELCSRPHLLFAGAGGVLRDCGERPAVRGDAPELQEYRRAREQERARPERPAERVEPDDEAGEWAVVAARAGGGGVRCVLVLGGRAAAARVSWRGAGAGAYERGGGERAHMAAARAASGAAVLGGRLVVCGGYDSARVLRAVEAYDPVADAWSALADMCSARARFPAARLGGALLVVGGSDGHAELASVDALEGGTWRALAPLPQARADAAAAVDEACGELFVAGGWAGGRPQRSVHRYSAKADRWEAAPALGAARSQCAGAVWERAVWVLGGCDVWNCFASTEFLPLDDPVAWRPGPPLPTARRSVGAASWRGWLVAAGGWSHSAPLAATALLAPGGAWAAGPPLRRARASPALAELDGALYAAGGFSSSRFLACVECLLEPDQPWTTLHSPGAPTPTLTPPADHSNAAAATDLSDADAATSTGAVKTAPLQ